MDMMKQLVDEDSAIVSIYYGEDTDEEDANALGEKIERHSRMSRSRFHYGCTADLLICDFSRIRME